MNGRPSTLGVLAVLASVLSTRSAHANGRFPASNQVVFSPSDPNLIVGRTTFGILPSRDNGASWHWICEDALAFPKVMSVDPEIALTAGNALIAGVPEPYMLGLDVSSDLGCNWSCQGGALAGQYIADVVVRPTSPHSVLALLSGSLTPDGGGTPPSVFQSVDDGATWAPFGVSPDATDPTLILDSIDVARTDPQRVYVSGVRGYGAARTALLFVSTDDGASWTTRTVAGFDPQTEGSIFIGAVDPTDAARVYLRSAGTFVVSGMDAVKSCDPTLGRSRIFWTPDSGASFAVASIPATCQLLGLAVSADGSKVYAGSWGDGLFAAARAADLKFEKKSSIRVECLATRGPELWACSDEASGFLFGSSTNDGVCFMPRLHLLDVSGPIACSPSPGGPRACQATDNASQCTEPLLQQVCVDSLGVDAGCFGGAEPREAGCATGPSDGGPPPPADASAPGTKPPASCGCSTPGGTAAGGGLAGLVLAAATVRRRRRAR